MSSSDSESSFVHKKRHKEKKGKRDRSRSTSRSRNRKDRKEKKRRRHDSKSSSSSSRKNKNKNIKREDRKRKHEIEDLKDREIQRRQQMESKRKTEEDLKKKKKLKEESHQKEELTEEEKLKRKKQSRYAKAIAVALLDSVDEKKKENEVLKNDELEDFMQIKNEQKTKDILVDELENFEDAQIETPLQLPQLTFNFMNKKMPQLPKEFLKNKTETKITETRKLSDNEDEDPLDAYMKSIEKEAVIQDYELVQMLNRQELQRQYDEIAEKQDSVIMIDSIKSEKKDLSEEIEISENLPMVVTLDDIFQEKQPQQDENEEEDEEFHKKFIECLKGTKVPEYDPILGYTFINEEKKENVIYQEDVNEFRKEADFVEMEEAWRNAKKSGEKGKELKLVNHAEIDYEPFRKDFYKESKEIAMMTEEEVVNYRKENGDIKIRGKNIPKPISNWYQCGFYEKILAVLEKKGYKKPFPIQAQGVPCIMSGRDVIGIAETGSGKTLAYVLPMLRHVLDQRRLREGEGPISIIFAPTRELATQIYSVVKSFTKILNLRVSCVYGGSGIGPQVSELRRGAEIVVCTPGRMIEILCMNNGKVTNLQRVTFVVIDEADRMFDMGFEPQLSRILANIRPDKQTVMFSATFPKQIENLAKKILSKPIEIVVGQRGQSCSNVIQYVEVLDENEKLLRLLQILGDYSEMNYEDGEKQMPIGIIIFVDQQSEADELYKEIFQRGYQPLLIHGGQDQEDRNFAIYDFKTGVRNILISTSVCARGLDVKHCGLVINFKCPNHMEDYVHRVGKMISLIIGRTGRAGRKGEAFTFISKEEAHLADDIMKVLEVSNQIIPHDLEDLVKVHKENLESGQVDKHKVSGYWGRGYEFSKKERDSAFNTKKEIGKGYLMLESDDEELEIKGRQDIQGSKETSGKETTENKMALAVFKNDAEQRLIDRRKAIMKDKTAQQIALDVGANAVKNAIIAGKSEEEALQIAQDAIERVLADYKPSVSVEKGAEQAAKIIEEWVERENFKNNIFTCELDINEYPANARSKVIRKDYINSINELSGCTVTLRGIFVEPNKKPPLGQKRLHLYIQGNSKQDVLKAYREIKNVLDETALMYYTMGSNSTGPGKYKI